MDKFFILGLPRSRTFWLSEFLGCMHEGLHYYNDYSEFMGSEYTGDSTTCYPWIKDHIKNHKKVVIDRDINDAWESSVKLFPNIEYEALLEMQEELDEIDDCLRVKYEDINDNLKEIWQYCIGDGFDISRADKLKAVHLENYPLIKRAQIILKALSDAD